jgi:hypothetical protein
VEYKMLTIRVTREEYDDLRRLADAVGESMNSYVRGILRTNKRTVDYEFGSTAGVRELMDFRDHCLHEAMVAMGKHMRPMDEKAARMVRGFRRQQKQLRLREAEEAREGHAGHGLPLRFEKEEAEDDRGT